MQENIIKIAAIGLGAYLAYSYLQKRKESNTIETVAKEAPKGEIVDETPNSDIQAKYINAAGSCTCADGTTGYCAGDCATCCAKLGGAKTSIGTSVGGSTGSTIRNPINKKRSVSRHSMSRADGWDSDTVSVGM